MATPGRPRSFDIGVILDRAVDLFWRHGYRETTTRELEQALGIRQSSLYNTFGSKQALMEAALDRYQAMTEAALITPLESAPDPLGAIDDFFDGLADWVAGEGRGGCMIINLMAEDGGVDSKVTARTCAYRRRVRGALHQALVRGAGESHAEVRADLLFGTALAINLAARGAAPAEEIKRLVAGAHYLVKTWRATGSAQQRCVK